VTWGFVASFGGVVLVMGAMLVVEKLLARSTESEESANRGAHGELAAALTRAEAAAKQAAKEIATARSIAIRS
jgi:hypothetical protein